jgi:tetratricopeptide (TPR) repeat protein
MKNLYGLGVLLLAGFVLAAPAVEAAGSSGSSGSTFSSSSRSKSTKPVDSYYQQAEKRIKAEDWKGAIALLEKSLARNAKSADAENLMGYSHRKMGNYDRAFKHYAQALDLNPKHLGAHEYVGEAYLKIKDLKKAKVHLGNLGNLCAYDCPEYRDLRKQVMAFEKAAKGKSS